MDRPTGRVIRRYERDRPGELVHVDIKKLGRIPDGGGWRANGREGQWRHQDQRAVTGPAHRLRLHPFGGRRPQPAGLFGDPGGRAQRDRRRVLATCRHLVRPARHRGRGGADRQRVLLPKSGLRRGPGRRQASPDPALSTADQRQGRTVQPHDAGGMGLRQALRLTTPNASRRSATSCISTIITAATLLSGESHRSAASTTLRVTTPRISAT